MYLEKRKEKKSKEMLKKKKKRISDNWVFCPKQATRNISAEGAERVEELKDKEGLWGVILWTMPDIAITHW